jgi:uncharacterized protein (TIGR04255 family)
MAQSSDTELFFSQFTSEAAKAGFMHAERLVPSGFPSVLHSIVYRLRRTDGGGSLLQIGPGLFSANSLQPYRSWHDFVSTVRTAVSLLLKTRPVAEQDLPLTQLTLRYLNAFKPDLLQGRTEQAFVRDVLGFETKLPEAIQRLNEGASAISSHLQFVVPMTGDKKQLKLSVGEGALAGSGPAIVLDMSVVDLAPLPPDLDAIMNTFGGSRDILHDAFLGMTTQIRDAMRPQEY